MKNDNNKDNNRDNNRKHLYYLNELSDFKVDSDDPDVRGWEVKDADNRVIGKVDNLLVSKEKKKVVYLDVEVDKSIIEANHDPYGKPASGDVHEFINKDGENHLILPVGLAKLNEDQKFVYTDRINRQTFAETKRMEKGYDVDRDYEVVVLESYNRDLDEDYNRGTTGMSGNRTSEKEGLRENERTTQARRVEDDDQIVDTDRNNNLNQRGDRDRATNDDDFYDRREFDRRDYRSNR